MKQLIFTAYLLFGFTLSLFAQIGTKSPSSLKFFNRTELSYNFGLNETFPGDKTNSFRIKTILGYALPQVGLGLGLENSNFKSSISSGGSNFNTFAFSLNLHLLAKKFQSDGVNFFVKGSGGYAVRFLTGYNKGLNYEGGAGILVTTKKGSKYYFNGVYNYQEIDDFILASGKLNIKSVGLGIGTWF
ncbi:hypothetical protein N9R54_02470 [Pelobium sp.]|nr:hypothetical protein [Pelobium sp.]MDA9555078.1 hypothetical protein [Pelobium sp.]